MTNQSTKKEWRESCIHGVFMEYANPDPFLESKINEEVEHIVTIAVEEERNRWINQSANEHDNRIREEFAKKVEKAIDSHTHTDGEIDMYANELKEEIFQIINPKDIYLNLCSRCGGNHKVKDCVVVPIKQRQSLKLLVKQSK